MGKANKINLFPFLVLVYFMGGYFGPDSYLITYFLTSFNKFIVSITRRTKINRISGCG
jgi:hypothetical protein